YFSMPIDRGGMDASCTPDDQEPQDMRPSTGMSWKACTMRPCLVNIYGLIQILRNSYGYPTALWVAMHSRREALAPGCACSYIRSRSPLSCHYIYLDQGSSLCRSVS